MTLPVENKRDRSASIEFRNSYYRAQSADRRSLSPHPSDLASFRRGSFNRGKSIDSHVLRSSFNRGKSNDSRSLSMHRRASRVLGTAAEARRAPLSSTSHASERREGCAGHNKVTTTCSVSELRRTLPANRANRSCPDRLAAFGRVVASRPPLKNRSHWQLANCYTWNRATPLLSYSS